MSSLTHPAGKETQISSYLSVFSHTDPKHTASIYAAAVVNVVKLSCYICVVCIITNNCIILLFSICPSALGQIMLYVDGMNGVIRHAETIQWLYTLVGSKVDFSVLQNSKKNSGESSPVIV